jgi:PAS domain S-box-containing protein
MKRESIRVLLIEDNAGDARLVREMLADPSTRAGRGTPFELEYAERLSTGLEHLAAGGIAALLLDLSLPDAQGLDAFFKAHAQAPDVPIIVLTGLADEALALEAVQEGAQDYLVKGQADSALLARATRYAVQRQQAEQALRVSEERFRGLTHTATDAIITIGPDERIRVFNRAAERIFGYVAGEIVGQEVGVLIPAEYGQRHTAGIRRYLETGQTTILGKTIECYGLRNGGEVFPLELSLSVVQVGGEVSFTGVIRDITERKQAEEQIRLNAARAAALANTAAHLNAQLDVNAVLNTVCEETARALNVSATGVTLLNNRGDALCLAAAFGLPPEYREHHRPTPRAILDEYARQMGAVMVEQIGRAHV